MPLRPLLTTSTIIAAALCIQGCGGDVRYDQRSLSYDKHPLQRPKEAKTFNVVVNPGSTVDAQQVRINGMQRQANSPDLLITVKGGEATWSEPSIVSEEKLTYDAWFKGGDGKDYDGTNYSQISQLGYREQVVKGAVLTCYRFAEGDLMAPASMVVTKADGTSLESFDLSASEHFRFGDQPGAMTYRVELGDKVRTNEATNVFVDRLVISQPGQVVALNVAKASEGQLQNNLNTPAVANLRKRWNEVCRNRVETLKRTHQSNLNDYLEQYYASGPRSFAFEFGAIEKDAGFESIGTRFNALVATPTTDEADRLRKELAGYAGKSDLDVRAKAMIAYDQALVELAVQRFPVALKDLEEARRINDSEKDGVFSSSGAKTKARIDALREHVLDRQRRALAASK